MHRTLRGYLHALRKLTSDNGALLIVDEVMTGFRLALGGALELYNLDADLVTLGKILGGGLPCGAFGGKRRFMELLAPLGPVYQAGTLSGNPLAMAAGLATVGYLYDHAGEVYPQLEAVSKAVAEGVAAEAASAGVPVTLNRVGSMWTWFFTPNAVANYDDAAKSDTAAFGRFHRAMMESGVWLPPSQFEAMFLGTAHGEAEVQAAIAAAREAFFAYAQRLSVSVSLRYQASGLTNCRFAYTCARSCSPVAADGAGMRDRHRAHDGRRRAAPDWSPGRRDGSCR